MPLTCPWPGGVQRACRKGFLTQPSVVGHLRARAQLLLPEALLPRSCLSWGRPWLCRRAGCAGPGTRRWLRVLERAGSPGSGL